MSTDNYYLIVPASGTGSRMGAKVAKQYLQLDNGKSVLDQTLEILVGIDKIKGYTIAISATDELFKKSEFAKHPKLLSITTGGSERFQSVVNALEQLKPHVQDNDWVLVHDAARPCVKAIEVINLMDELKDHPTGGLLATKTVDTIKKVNNNIVKSTIDRSKLWQAQTPQMYRFGVLSKALKIAVDDNINITDESSAIENLGLDSVVIPSSKSNIKITNSEDLELANFYLKQHNYAS